MLSLLTYGATFGVADSVNTRHEFDVASFTAASSNAIDSEIDSEVNLEIDLETEQAQRTTKGGVIGRLRRLIQRRT